MLIEGLQTQRAPEYLLDSVEFSLEILVLYVGYVLAKELMHQVDTVLIIRNIVT